MSSKASKIATLNTHEERVSKLKALLRGDAPTGKRGIQAAANPASGVLWGVALHAASLHSQKKQLSSLELSLLRSLKIFAGDEEISEYGKLYAEHKRNLSENVKGSHNQSILILDDDASYTDENLLKDAQRLAPEILAMPNNKIVDISATDTECFDTPEYVEAIKQNGGGITVFTGPDEEKASSSNSTSAALSCKIYCARFKCITSSGDQWGGERDEIYWCGSWGSDGGDKQKLKTPEFGSVVSGNERDFPPASTLFEGMVQEHMAGVIQCWEADQSNSEWYKKLQDVLMEAGQAAVEASQKASPGGGWGSSNGSTEKGEAILALIGLWMQFLSLLLGWITNKDDLVCERQFAFTKSGLLALLAKPESQMSFVFDGGSVGKHELWIRALPYAKPTGSIICSTYDIKAGGWTTQPTNIGASKHGMTLATHSGSLVGCFRADDSTLWATKYDGNAWLGPYKIAGNTSTDRVALESMGGSLFMVYRDLSGRIKLTSSTNLFSWSSPLHVSPGAVIYSSPALTYLNGSLILVVRGTDNAIYWAKSDNGTSWSGVKVIASPAPRTNAGPSICTAPAGYVVATFRGGDNKLWWMKYTADGKWSTNSQIGGNLWTGTAIAAHKDHVYCVLGGGGSQLYTKAYSLPAGPWKEFYKVPGAWSDGEQGIYVFQDKLWCVYGCK